MKNLVFGFFNTNFKNFYFVQIYLIHFWIKEYFGFYVFATKIFLEPDLSFNEVGGNANPVKVYGVFREHGSFHSQVSNRSRIDPMYSINEETELPSTVSFFGSRMILKI